MTTHDLDWGDYEADGEAAADDTAFQWDGKWFSSEEEWYEAQSPEVQAEFDAWQQRVMDEVDYDALPAPDYDTRYLDGP